MSKTKVDDAHFDELWKRAKLAGLYAGEQAKPNPMVVGQAKDLTSDEIDPTKPVYYESEGMCGFAWVNVRPGTSRFARWLKAKDYARRDTYYGGVTIWISEHGQSVARKEAHARAMAETLGELADDGIMVLAMSRLD